jgi:glycosyltransferase involved in cell wall biosynthesis
MALAEHAPTAFGSGVSPEARPRVLFLSPFEPWCRENGSSVVIADILGGLSGADGFDMLPVFLRKPPADRPASSPPSLEWETLGIEPLPKWFSVPLAVGTGRSPWWEVRFRDAAVARRIARLARFRRFAPTVIHVEHLVLVPIGRFLARTFNCPLVYRAHNIESQLWGRRLGTQRSLKRAFIRRLEAREAGSIREADLTLCISDVDLRWAREHAPEARCDVLPVGLGLDRFADLRVKHPVIEKRMCFVGGLDWPPNEIGLKWFVDEVLSRINSATPNIPLAVLSRGAESRPWLADHPGVRVLSQDVEPASLFASSRVSIAPLLEGGGVRVKILESLASGCPVVATSIGGEGLALAGLTHTDDPAEFARACVSAIDHSSYETRTNIREAVAARHGADVVARELIERWTAMHAMRRTT